MHEPRRKANLIVNPMNLPVDYPRQTSANGIIRTQMLQVHGTFKVKHKASRERPGKADSCHILVPVLGMQLVAGFHKRANIVGDAECQRQGQECLRNGRLAIPFRTYVVVEFKPVVDLMVEHDVQRT